MNALARTGLVSLFALSLPGCTDLPNGPIDTVVPQVLVESGDLQDATPGVELGHPLVARVLNVPGGAGGAVVTWRIKSGGGAFLTPATVPAGADGLVQVRFAPGTHRTTVTASVGGVTIVAAFRTLPPTEAVYRRESAPQACASRCEHYRFFTDGTFALVFPQAVYPQGGEFPGVFTVQNSIVSLAFSGQSTAGAWTATGTFRGDSLAVAYNAIMAMSDFEDAVYVLDVGSILRLSRPGEGQPAAVR